MQVRPGRLPRRPLSAIVLAAGEGTRMRSRTPKPLHRLCGRPMILHVLDTLAELTVDRAVIVVGHGANEVTKILQAEAPPGLALEFVEQPEQRGTGDAVGVALTGFPESYFDVEEADLVVLPGDTPLVRPATLAALIRHHREQDAAATMLTAHVDEPFGYSRVLRDKDGAVSRLLDDAACTSEELEVEEVATQIYCFRHNVLALVLRRVAPDQTTGEYFLTATIEILHDAGYTVTSLLAVDPMEAAGVNDRAQLAAADAELRSRINERFMRGGVTMADPEATYIDVSVVLGSDVTILPGVILEGTTSIGDNTVLGPDTHLVDCKVGSAARIERSVGERAIVGDNAFVGPFSVLEPGSRLAPGTRVGPFFGRA
ncbi:MAG: bifunctional UDP-N-acetylglucosamine diphosphorylase/glucosamine-1-phosphate N-acetyltransferase GlmU [Acidimicrobiales bacterium]